MKNLDNINDSLLELSHGDLVIINGRDVAEITSAILRYIGKSFNRDGGEQMAYDLCHKMYY